MAKKNNNTEKVGFVNPFEAGVNYEQFLNAIPEGVTVEDYCKGNLEQSQIDWLIEDLKHFTNK